MRARKRTTNTENYVALIVFLFGIIGILSAFWDDITADKKLALTLASLALFMLTERLASFVSSLKETETRDDIKDIIIDGVAGLRSELRSNSMVTALS